MYVGITLTQSKENKKRKKEALCFLGHFKPKGNLPILLQICRKFAKCGWKSKTFLHFMFEIEKSVKSVGNFPTHSIKSSTCFLHFWSKNHTTCSFDFLYSLDCVNTLRCTVLLSF